MYAGMRKYGVAATFDFPVYNPDGIDLDVDWVPVQADCELIKDGGTSTAITATAVDEGVTYSITLTTTEMECARGVIKIQDAATKVILDIVLTFETYGDAAAQHAFDFDAANVTVGSLIANAITAASINAAAFTEPKFGADFITAAKIADNAISADQLATDCIGGIQLANNAIGASQIATGAIDVSALAAGSITAAAVSDAAVDKIRDGLLPTQNVAFNNIEFLFVSSVNHATPVTGAGTMAVTRSIDGGAFGAGTGTGPAEVGNGMYQYDASAADMNGGIITFRFTATTGTPAAPDDRFVTIVTGGGV